MNGKPDLQTAFRRMSVLVTNQGNYAVLLLISPTNHDVGWIEYATWSRQPAKYHFLSILLPQRGSLLLRPAY